MTYTLIVQQYSSSRHWYIGTIGDFYLISVGPKKYDHYHSNITPYFYY